MKKLLVASIAAALCGAPVLAADIPTKAPAPAYVGKGPVAAFDWSGFYIGGDAGWQGSRIGLSSSSSGPLTYDPHHDSFALGAHVGAQRQWGQLVLGVEGGYVAGFGKASLGTTPSISIFAPGGIGTGDARLKDIWSVGGRAGWAMGNWMAYVTGGYANGSFRFNASDNNSDTETAKVRPDGRYIGGGIEWALMNNVIFGVEYRHYGFNAKTGTGVRTDVPAPEPVRFDPKTDTVVARLSYKFDWGKSPVVAKY